MMRTAKKERLYISQLIEDPALTYPTYYTLSKYQHQNEFLQDAIISIHSANLSNYKQPKQVDELFLAFKSGRFAIYKEYYIVGFFGGKVMFLEPYGWKSMGMNEGIFDMRNWLV
jgi:hypothetical protein